MKKLIALDMACGDLFLSSVKTAWDDGDAVLPIDQRLPHDTKAAIVARFQASVVIDKNGKSALKGAAVESDDAVVIATSGTTGSPKGVVLTHEAMEASSKITSHALSVRPDSDIWLCCLPVSHIGGFSVISRAIHTGTTLEMHAAFDAAKCAESARNGVSLVSLVPTALKRVDNTIFRKILIGGSAMPSILPENVVSTYGMTETGSGIVYDGFPLEGVEIEIRNGEIYVQTPTLFRTYLDQQPEPRNGWFATGDAGRIDENGKLVVSGRLDDAIITGGEKVWPIVIERHINTLQLFREVIVVGRPDNNWGQLVTVVAIPSNPEKIPTIDNLRDQLDPFLPRYALPKAIEIVDHLPRNHSGKILRNRI